MGDWLWPQQVVDVASSHSPALSPLPTELQVSYCMPPDTATTPQYNEY